MNVSLKQIPHIYYRFQDCTRTFYWRYRKTVEEQKLKKGTQLIKSLAGRNNRVIVATKETIFTEATSGALTRHVPALQSDTNQEHDSNDH